MTTARGWLYVAALTLSVTIGWPTPAAQASCLRVAPAVVWSYPSANAVDVPIDADVFLILNNSDRPTSIALNGLLVRATGPRQFDPGPLLPLTEYLVTVEAAGPYWAPGDTVTLELRFTTGTSTSPPQSAPTLSGVDVEAYAHSGEPCARLIPAQACLDTQQDAVMRANVVGDATLWLLESLPTGDAGPVGPHTLSTWPASCGDPLFVTHLRTLDTTPMCVRVTGVSASGDRMSSNVVCRTTSSGCAVGAKGSAEGAWTLLMVLGVVWLRRRQGVRAWAGACGWWVVADSTGLRVPGARRSR